MATNIGPKIGIDGEAQYRAELNNIIQQAKTLDAQMKEVSSAFDDATKSQDAATKAAEIHARQVEVQQERVDKLKEMVEKSSEATGENSTQTLKWQEALANAKAELNELEKGTGDTAKEVDGLSQAMDSSGPSFKNGLVAGAKAAAAALAAVTAATAAVVAGITKAVGETAAYGDEIDKESQKLGISAEAYQEWDAVLQHSGSSISALKAPMKNLANLAVEGSDAFGKLGISQEEVASMSQEELFSRVITELQGMEEGTERAALAQDLLGKSAQDLAPLLNTSAEDTQAMKDRVHELGGVMSDDAVKAAAGYQDSLQDLQTAMTGLKNGMTAELMPGITQVMDGLTAIFSGDSEGGIQMISDGVHNIVDTITEELPKFLELGKEILTSILTAITDNLPELLGSAAEIIGELIAGLIEAIPELILMAPDIIMAIVQGLVNAWPKIKDAGKELISKVGEGISDAIENAKAWGKDLIDNFVGGIKEKFGKVGEAIGGIGQGIKDLLGFSEPKEGPLSNFHTFAPDMMELFAKGIRDNAYLAEDAMANAAAGIAGATTNNTALNYGGVSIQVYGAEGQDVRSLAYEIMDIMQDEVNARRAAVV